MNTYGYMALFMGVLSIIMTFAQTNLSWLIGGAFSFYLAWSLLSPGFEKKSYDSTTRGQVISIRANGTFLAGPHQPLHDAEIGYLDRIKKFKNLPPSFIHEVSVGDFVEISYNSKKPDQANVNYQ